MRAVPQRTGRHILGGRLVFGPSSARPLSAVDLARTESLWYSTLPSDFATRSAERSSPPPTGAGR